MSDGSLIYTPGISSRDGTNSTWSHGDIKNSLRQTAANESTSATKHYDAFGNETTSTGTWQGPFQYGGNFGYQTDPDSNLKLLGHRYYDPGSGRFLTRDLAKHDRNWYVYCASNRVGTFDATGHVGRKIGDDEMVDLYAKVGRDGYEKVGKSLDSSTRYSKKGLAATNSRVENLDRMPNAQAKVIERAIEEHFPGPENRVRWAGAKPLDDAPENVWRYVRKIGKFAKPLVILVLLVDGPEAAARDLVFADEVDAVGSWVKEKGRRLLDNASNAVSNWYKRRAGLDESDAQYGMW